MKTGKVVLLTILAVALGWIALGHSVPVSADARTPRIVAHQSLTGQTADVTLASFTAPSDGGDYRVTAYITKTAGPHCGAVAADYTDDAGAQEPTIGVGLGDNSGVILIHATSSSSVSISTMNTQNCGSQMTYNVYATVEEL